MTIMEWAVICTLHQEPDYQFQYDEAKLARRMKERGLLRSRGNKMYAVTAKGEREYASTRIVETRIAQKA